MDRGDLHVLTLTPTFLGHEPFWIYQNPAPCTNTATQLLDLGFPAPWQSITVWAIQDWVNQNETQPGISRL